MIAGAGAALVWAAAQPLPIAVPVFVVGLVVIAGRQLALAILHHEAAHRSLFESRRLNEWIGDWLCARPVWSDLKKYRTHHLIHHRNTNQPDDSDRSLIEPFPTTRASLARKLLRDVSGLTGLKYLFGRVLMDAGVLKWTIASDVTRLPRDGRAWWSYPLAFFKNASGMLLTNAILLAACWASGHTWLYAVWVLAYVTPFPLLVRVRSLAEHACTEATLDMSRTRARLTPVPGTRDRRADPRELPHRASRAARRAVLPPPADAPDASRTRDRQRATGLLECCASVESVRLRAATGRRTRVAAR